MIESKVLDGKLVSAVLEEAVKNKVLDYKEEYNDDITLATIIVGSDKASKTYVNMKSKACQRVGIQTRNYSFPEFTTEDLINLIQTLNEDTSINGILIQHPLPKNIDEQKCFDQIATEKDVDGLSSKSFGKMAFNEEAFGAATPSGIIHILDFYNIDVTGKKACVVGRSPILGKPLAAMLLNRNATVTICHSKTKNLKEEVAQADIVVGAVGKPEFIKKNWLKKGAIVIDAGYDYVNGKTVGDIENPSCIASLYTPVPGGVGPVTIATLLTNTIAAANMQASKTNTYNRQFVKEERK